MMWRLDILLLNETTQGGGELNFSKAQTSMCFFERLKNECIIETIYNTKLDKM